LVEVNEPVSQDLFMLFIVVPLLLLISGSLLFYIWSAICTFRFFSNKQISSQVTAAEPVSILIPVCGIDENAEENWARFCQQNYEQYEVIFGVMNPDDPAVPIVKDIVTQYPDRAKLLLCTEVYGINHQVSNLIHLVHAAKSEIIIFADSDMQVCPNYLRQVTAPLADPTIGVVTCAYIGYTPESLGAAIAAMGRCFDFIPSALVALSLDGQLQFAFGPTIVTRKSVLNAFGGLQQIVNRIGSDYHIGHLATRAGYRVQLSTYLLNNHAPHDKLGQVYRRELRWARTIRFNRGAQYYGLAFTYGTIYAPLLLLLTGFQPWAIAVCLITWGVRLLEVLVAIQYMGCTQLRHWLWALPIREVMSFVIYLGSCFGQKVFWRGRNLRVDVGGVLSE
jgi:ceramide glucosyltransferase